MAQRRCDAVSTGITATNDDDVFAFGTDVVAIFQFGVQQAFGVRCQKFHGKMHADTLATGNWQVTRSGRTGCQAQSVYPGEQLVSGDAISTLAANINASDKFDTFFFKDFDAAVNHILLQFHVGNAIHQQPANAVSTLINGDVMPRLIELRSGGQAGRTGADYCHFFTGAEFRRIGAYPAMLKPFVDNGVFNILDGDGRFVDAKHT